MDKSRCLSQLMKVRPQQFGSFNVVSFINLFILRMCPIIRRPHWQ